jgi:TatA/E family protein of Tat protein translocase
VDTPLLAFGLQLPELIVIGLLALLIFGKRLPDVARSLGRGVVEFKKGLRGIETDVDEAVEVEHRATSELPASAKPAIEPEVVKAD